MGSQNYIRGPCATCMPLAEKSYTQIDYCTISNCIFNFNFLTLVLSEIGGPEFTLEGLQTVVAP